MPRKRKPAKKKATKKVAKKAPKKKVAKKAPKKKVAKKKAPKKKVAKKKAPKKVSAKARPAREPSPHEPVETKPAAPAPMPVAGIESHPLKPAAEVPGLTKAESRQLDEILARYDRSDAALLAILQDIQEVNNYLPRGWIEALSLELKIPRTRIYRLSTFFKSLSLDPRGKHICQVCIGTTCHVRGAPRLVDKFDQDLGLAAGQTTEDMQFTLETVGCVGACALGPLVVINKEYHGHLTVEGLGKILRKLKKGS